jgi:hypothetical protein
MIKKYVTLILFVIFFTLTSNIYAQGPAPPPPPPDTPIDGGIGSLLLIGIGYAIKKITDKKSN